MTIKEKITGLLKEKGATIRDLAISIGTTEVGLHYMFKNNSFKFDTIEKTSKYFNVDISYFAETNSNTNVQFNTQNNIIPVKNNTKIELQNPYETSIKAEKLKNNLVKHADVEEYINNLSISTLLIEVLAKYLEAGIFEKYKNLFNLILIDLDKGISTNTITDKYASELKELVENSNINDEALSRITKGLITIVYSIQKSSTDSSINESIDEIINMTKARKKRQ